MKARIIALIILLLIIGIPIAIYWAFFVNNTSGVKIILGPNQHAKVRLQGEVGLGGWLPLLSRIAKYETDCIEECEFSPIAPIGYKISITGDDIVTISDEFWLEKGKISERRYNLTSQTYIHPIDIILPMSPEEKQLRNQDIALLGPDFEIIGRDKNDKIWALQKMGNSTAIGLFSENRFFSLTTFPHGFERVDLDFWHDIIVLSHNQKEKILLTLDFKNIFETTVPDGANEFFFSDNTWHAITPERTLAFVNNSWQKNVRFSHWIDFGKWRAGYISEKDIDLLKLSNYDPSKGSALVLLDRENGKLFEVSRGQKIDKLFVMNGIIFSSDNTFFTIRIP